MLFALLLALTSPDAKPLVVDRAEVRRIVSKENAYKLYVALPHDYGKKRYPVVDVLDADVLADETHNSIFPRALSNGLRFVFEGRSADRRRLGGCRGGVLAAARARGRDAVGPRCFR